MTLDDADIVKPEPLKDRRRMQLRAALERYESAENWATLAALLTACHATCGAKWAQEQLDHSPAWQELVDGERP